MVDKWTPTLYNTRINKILVTHMTTKRKNYQADRRKVRRAEKRNLSDTAPIRDIPLGRTTRRGWGEGKALQ